MMEAREQGSQPSPEVAPTDLPGRLRELFRISMPIPRGIEPHLAEALDEALSRTGNFIRAQIVYRIAQAYGAPEQDALRLAIALEYFHTASLLFDDLPSMDDAAERRGATCIHLLHGEGATILVALAIINRAYAMLWTSVADASPGDRARALAYVERYLGLGGLLNGQSHDLHYSEKPVEQRSPQQVALGKTSALIRLSMVVPALIGGAGPRVVALLDRLAVMWGLAYQAIDDLKDVMHASETAGKTTLRDELLDRPNLALTIGPDATLDRLDRLVAIGERIVDRLEAAQPWLVCLEQSKSLLWTQVHALRKERTSQTA